MANNNQTESALPVPGANNRTVSDLLPRYFRTEANKKFLQATLDQLVQPGVVEKITGYFGRKNSKAFVPGDNYIADVSAEREAYQLEPALVIKDDLDNVTFYKDYNDYINQLRAFGANVDNHSRLNSQETYAWNPNIDWDKFVNFREYYWLPTGPAPVRVTGQAKTVVSTYTVSLVDNGDNVSYLFSPDGLTSNPTLRLFRGQTYRFEIDTPGHPLAFAISRTFTPGNAIIVAGTEGIRGPGLFDAQLYGNEYDLGEYIVLPSSGSVTFDSAENVSTLYPDGIRKLGEAGEEIANVYVEKGTIEFTIPLNAPDRLFYISKNDVDVSGLIRIEDIEENTFLNVETDVLGKKTYKSANGVEFTNGLRVKFLGSVEPVQYSESTWYVEGVGDKIRLINENDLVIPATYSQQLLVPFDSDGFDTLPFANSSSYAGTRDYIVVNRASRDRNPWSRYNKWFHKDVVVKTAQYNNTVFDLDENHRAKRPIIEFEAGLKLKDYGTQSKRDIDVIDTFTTDVFSTIEGSFGYNIDGIDLAEGTRVLFTADTDILVKNKIYQVKFITIGNNRQISLIETEDTDPLENEVVFVLSGDKFSGKSFYFNGSEWKLAQDKTKINQHPLFDLCCPQGNFYGDYNVFGSSTFRGTKLFSYKEGTGSVDSELGFPLSYKNIQNTGDIVFEFNLLTDTFTFQEGDAVFDVSTSVGNLRKYSDRTTFDWVNGWSKTPAVTKQKVLRQYVTTETFTNQFEVDMFDRPADLQDLRVNVFVNNKLQKLEGAYTLDKINGKVIVRFFNDLPVNSTVLLKAWSSATKNKNGWYEFPINLDRNPLNDDITEFTLGEVIDHVDSMIEDLYQFDGTYPGVSNLRDLGELDQYGKRFVKHSGPINLPLYHVTNKKYNIIKALDYSRREYSRFKRILIETATNYGFDGPIKTHLDYVLFEINKDKVKTQPFYFSDMLNWGNNNTRIEYTILDANNPYYSISQAFNLSELSQRSINVYLNDNQLVHEKDYTFNSDGFLILNSYQQEGDILTIYDSSSTDGSFVPPTPTKLGLYPKYVPQIIIDDTFVSTEPTVNGPFKIYGERDGTGQVGWFYPVYTSKRAAQAADANNSATAIRFIGLNKLIYIPTTSGNYGASDNPEFDEYPIGVALVRGHDGSFIKAYKDYRDLLLLEFEKRIFNNIKVSYDSSLLDLTDFVPSKFRSTQFTRQEINDSLSSKFTEWLSQLVDSDFTSNDFYDRENQFTFNYSLMTNVVDGSSLPGFWRGVYLEMFDTDRPHTHPWEILGFAIKPSWWDDVYGLPPYTGNNGVMWSDIEQGIIREPGKPVVVLEKYARPGLSNFIPVDARGNLISPLAANIAKNFVYRNTSLSYKFGDVAPVESAWRRSSEYPFALIEAWLKNQPAKVLGIGFDTSRIYKNLAGQYVYKDTLKNIRMKDIVLPNTYADTTRVQTSGLINYIYNLVASDILTVYEDYKQDLATATNQLGFKLAGFTDKSKFKILLDSKSPRTSQSEGIFVPEENYKIFLNTSSPVKEYVYSAVIVEKAVGGFIIRGYDVESPFFNYFEAQTTQVDPVVTVGGLTESATEWAASRAYFKGQLLINNFKYYRVTENFTSGPVFSTDKLALLPEAPIVGGKRAVFKKNFYTKSVKKLPYGTKLASSQEVVDFILGYNEFLKSEGFEFEYFNRETTYVENWDHAAREFLFWTTQGWAAGTTISLSPGASAFTLTTGYSTADDIFDPFYNYGVIKQDGNILDRQFVSIYRNKNVFEIKVKNTTDGLYSVVIPAVQKEHVVLIDNATIFNDVIFEPATGYRQERLKVTGYRSDNWTGSLDIPGFVFDNAEVTDWQSWRDYKVGDLVKYKQFYYVAAYPVVGSEEFNSTFWYRLNEKPVPELIANFDYKINQFADFYDLDSDNFDAEQQRLAQHLIGYQKREYLANIINDDVSQYKFYQGFIQDKGTKNAITKLFDPLGSANKDSFEYYEDWAIQVGRYGAVDNIQQVEFQLDETKFQVSPQPFELVQTLPVESFDKIYRIRPFELYDKPADYNHTPFPTTTVDPNYLMSSGYVHENDVQYKAGSIEDLEATDINQLQLGEYIWLTRTNDDNWTVYQLSESVAKVTAFASAGTFTETNKPIFTLTLDRWAAPVLNAGELVAVKGASEYNLNGLYLVDFLDSNTVNIALPISNDAREFDSENFVLVRLRTVRVKDLIELNTLIQEKLYPNQRVWVDEYVNGKWASYINNPVYLEQQTLTNPGLFDSTDHDFSKAMTVSDNNYNFVVSAPNDSNGIVYHYRRTKDTNNLVQEPAITPEDTLFDPTNSKFGESISLSPDSEFLAVGVPYAGKIKTRFKGDFDPTETYNKNDIVRYRESLWKANRQILPTTTSQPFTTFDTYVQIASIDEADSTTIKLLLAGNPGLENSISDHFLVRAPLDMYLGTQPGDRVKLAWNPRSFAYPTLDNYVPFDGEIPELENYIENIHVIESKIDHILFVETFVGLPEAGERVTTDTGSGIVHYVDIKGDSAVVYIKDTNGVFDITGELYINDTDFIGIYSEDLTYTLSANLGGFWLFKTYKEGEPPQGGYTSETSDLDGFTYSNNSRWIDVGRGLVYVDVVTEEFFDDTTRPYSYYNIQETISEVGSYVTLNNQASYIKQLSYFGDPNGVEANQPSPLWVVRGPKAYTDSLTAGDTVQFSLYDLDNRVLDLTPSGFTYAITNKSQTVVDLWDGYIDFEYTEFDSAGNIFEIQVGDILVDVQYFSDGAGGTAPTPSYTSAVEVVFYQRNFNNARVYVKKKTIASMPTYTNTVDGITHNLTHEWRRLNNVVRFQLRRVKRTPSDVDRTFGTVAVANYNNAVVLGTSKIGKLIVFNAGANFPVLGTWDNVPAIVDEEYYFFNEITVGGTARDENPPNGLNKDYVQVYNIPADEYGVEGPDGAGAVSIYRRTNNGTYRHLVTLSSEYSAENRNFGKKVKIVKNKGLYTLFVSSIGDTTQQNYGSIELFKHGYEDQENFRGSWNINIDYAKNDIVVYRDDYYKAVKNITSDYQATVFNPVYWNKISWRQAKDENYRGELNTQYPYAINSIVNLDNVLYRAKTNIAAGATLTTTDWEVVSADVDYLGYLPNRTGSVFYGEDVFEPSNAYVEQFGEQFEVNQSGSILAVLSKQINSDSSTSVRLWIYRLLGERYNLDQILDLNTNTTKIAMSPDGNIIAASEPENDDKKVDQGRVIIYRQVNGEYVYSQTLLPPQNEASEKFGFSIAFSSDNLVVSSLNGDMKIATTFDVARGVDTTFDKGYTTFNNVIRDTGVVYVFEDIEDRLVYSESFRYDNATIRFGESLLATGNHIYVGMPYVESATSKGSIIEYRKGKGARAWNKDRELVPPVNLNRIRGAFLYNKRTNQIVTYLDYIDPIQGKIAGPAEQEITHKVSFDPATYNVGVFTGVNQDVFWAEEHVGEVWWNLKTARFTYPYQGDIQYQKANWNELQPGASIDVYEWVESRFLPSQWDTLADTEDGLREGISGSSVYGDNLYSQKFVYDPVAKTFSNRFYFWVERKLTVPRKENRRLSVFDIARLIAQPRQQGYRFISFLGDNKFILNNCESLIYNDDIVLNIRYAVNENLNQSLHSAYYIMSEGSESSKIHPDIERKWFDSLIGYDEQLRTVPGENLTVKQKYGVQNRPRQSMFVNRFEALKQYIDRVNYVLSTVSVVDSYDITPLLSKEDVPSQVTGIYDVAIDTIEELRFVSTNKLSQAKLTPVIQNGKIIRVDIEDSGRGYKVAPSYTLVGPGTDAEFKLTINNLGQVTGVTVLNGGKGYDEYTKIVVRRFSVLISSDATVAGKWAIYSWDIDNATWFRSSIQDFDVSNYWDYADWYDVGYNEFTKIDTEVDMIADLSSVDIRIGDMVKVNNVGAGGWTLFEKIANLSTEDITQNFKTVGRQNGTIAFKDSLYDYSKNTVGFDNRTYDSIAYDNNPTRELRIILNAVKNNLFVGSLSAEYNKLFFSSLRYVLSEQNYVDWLFKTSFIKIKHNLGELEQDLTFNTDTLESYRAYVEEVKPYKTVIREFVSSYETVDRTNSTVTDFDVQPYYDASLKKIVPVTATIFDNALYSTDIKLNEYPRKHWADTLGYSVKEIRVTDGGSGFTFKPVVKLVGGGGTGATAEAYLGYGKVTKIKVTNPGSGYISAPQVIIEGSQLDGGTPVKTSVILGNGTVRTPTIKIKFDRISGKYTITTFTQTETFTGTGADTRFDLEWPMDLNVNTLAVFVDGEEQLRSTYTFENIDNTLAGYTRQQGQIKFVNPPALDSVITVNYRKSIAMFNAADRINAAYIPITGMLGKDLTQLMDGVDYGGVEVTSFDFGGPAGWDTKPWYTDTWDTFDNTYEDEVFTFDGSTSVIELSTPLEQGMIYNFYLNGNRIDDPNYGTESQSNANAIMPSIEGDGVSTVIDLGIYGFIGLDNDVLIVRKYTSDGSFIPDPESYDTALSGGDLPYNTAKGVNAEEIIVEGDGFVTPTTSKGPEELVPGQILDALDIKVYTRDSVGQGNIVAQNYIGDGTEKTFNLGVVPGTAYSVFVKIDNQILADTDYVIDWTNNTVTLTAPNNTALSIVAVERGGQDIVDYGKITVEAAVTEYELPRKFVDGMSVFVTVNGVKQDVILYASEASPFNAVIRFAAELTVGAVINWTLFGSNATVNYSQITKDVFVGTGLQTAFVLSEAPFYAEPTSHNVIVKVGNRILNPGYNVQFTIPANRQREFALESFQQPGNALTTEDVNVYVNGVKIEPPVQWRFDIFNSSVILADAVGEVGDTVEIYVITDGDYTLSGSTLTLNQAPADLETVEVFKFSNHDLVGMERINYDIISRDTILPESVDYVTYNRLTVGEITLRKPAADVQYVWVTVNGELLTPSVDYHLVDNKTKVRLVTQPTAGDEIVVTHFTATFTKPKFAFRQFKDMLNRTHYKRLDAPATTLAQPLLQTDLRIEVVDGSQLPAPNKGANLPGIIWIEGERIEYFVKEGNTLRQLRRGTLGTGVKDVYAAGADLYDQNANKTIPYKDVTQVQTVRVAAPAGEESTYTQDEFTLNFTPNSIHEFEVFAAGRRLRKSPVQVFDPTIALDSPTGDVTVPAEFSINGSTLTLAEPLAHEQELRVIRKVGKIWQDPGLSLGETQNDIGIFLRAGTTKLPE